VNINEPLFINDGLANGTTLQEDISQVLYFKKIG
jgi:hypothetical protein